MLSVALATTLSGIYYLLTPSKNTTTYPLDPRTFTPFTLVSRTPVSSTSSIYTLRPDHASAPDLSNGPEHHSAYHELWMKGLWSVQFKQPQLQIARAYTPLPMNRPTSTSTSLDYAHPADLHFLIRHDPRGEVSSYLSRLRIGSTVEVRGPKMEYVVPREIEHVVFVAGGTGVAPGLQLGRTLLLREQQGDDRQVMPKIDMLWANRRREECLGGTSSEDSGVQSQWSWSWSSVFGYRSADPVTVAPTTTTTSPRHPIVESLETVRTQDPKHMTVSYFADDEGSFIDQAVLKRALFSEDARPTRESQHGGSSFSSADQPRQGRKLIIVCGPEGFVKYVAGNKHVVGVNRSRVGGLLGRLEVEREGWEVIRL